MTLCICTFLGASVVSSDTQKSPRAILALKCYDSQMEEGMGNTITLYVGENKTENNRWWEGLGSEET